MTVMTDATPAIRFFNEIHTTLRICGYDTCIDSLYQVRPPEEPWFLRLSLDPHVHTGKCAQLTLRLDEVSHNGRIVRAGLENLTLEPTDSSEARDNLRRDIDSHGDGMDSAALALFIADALDGAGISDK